MNTYFFSRLRCVFFIALQLIVSAHAADGSSAIENAHQRGNLLFGLSYPLPAYVAGAKSRTPESPETLLAETLAKRLNVKLTTLPTDAAVIAQQLQSGRLDIAIGLVNAGAVRNELVFLPTGYSAGAMAIMRTDTDIKTWEQLKGRTVCLSQGGAYVGKIAAQYGAIEKVQRAPADSLLALRIGTCDAAVHDDTLLNDLLKLPEWKKFSARLPAQSRQTMVLAVRADDFATLAYLRQFSVYLTTGSFWPEWKKKWANNVAFEVYLDQNVPDCH